MRLNPGLKPKLKLKESKSNQEQPQEVQIPEYKIDYVFYNNNQQQFNNEDSKCFKYVIQKKNMNEQMIITKDFVYTGETQNNKMNGIGKIYIQQYDAYCNNNYFVFEGQFKNDQIDGKGIEFYGKSNNKKIEGVFLKHSLVEKIQEYNLDGSILVKQNLQQSQLQQSFIQEDRNSNKMFRIKSAAKQPTTQIKQKSNDKWTKYDVELSKDHLSSLLSEKAINDQIIEAYINYLNYNDREQFFNLKSQNQIQQYKRSIVLPFFLIEQQKMDMLNLFMEYQYLSCQFWMIYQQIYTIVNQNGHWILVEINIEGQDLKMKIYDSQSKKKSIFYVATCKHIWLQFEIIVKQYNLNLSWKSKDVSVIECPQLQQPNDSGIFICTYLKYLISNISLDQITQDIINHMRKNELFNIVKKEK